MICWQFFSKYEWIKPFLNFRAWRALVESPVHVHHMPVHCCPSSLCIGRFLLSIHWCTVTWTKLEYNASSTLNMICIGVASGRSLLPMVVKSPMIPHCFKNKVFFYWFNWGAPSGQTLILYVDIIFIINFITPLRTHSLSPSFNLHLSICSVSLHWCCHNSKVFVSIPIPSHEFQYRLCDAFL